MNQVSATGLLLRLLAATALPLAVFGIASAVMSIPPDTQGIDIVAGRDLFRAHCGSCHFAKVGFPAHHGPNLHDIGKTGAARKPDFSAPQYILESILEPSAFIAPSGRPGMPPNVAAGLAPNDIRNIVGFLASCGAFPNYDDIVQLEIPDRRPPPTERTHVRLADMLLAENVLREKSACLGCHSLYAIPDGRVFAPALFGVGLADMAAVRESVVDPQRVIHPKYKSVTVALTDGEVISGQLIAKSESEVTLGLADDRNRFVMRRIPIGEIEQTGGELEIHESQTSIMPSGFDKSLSPQELEAVITLIHQLN